MPGRGGGLLSGKERKGKRKRKRKKKRREKERKKKEITYIYKKEHIRLR